MNGRQAVLPTRDELVAELDVLRRAEDRWVALVSGDQDFTEHERALIVDHRENAWASLDILAHRLPGGALYDLAPGRGHE